MANYISKSGPTTSASRTLTPQGRAGKYGIEPDDMNNLGYGADFAIDQSTTNKPDGAIALFSDGGWPSLDEEIVADRLELEDDEPAPAEHASVVDLVGSHLIEGEVAIFMEVGFEKMRVFGGTAIAINSAGETRRSTSTTSTSRRSPSPPPTTRSPPRPTDSRRH